MENSMTDDEILVKYGTKDWLKLVKETCTEELRALAEKALGGNETARLEVAKRLAHDDGRLADELRNMDSYRTND